MYQCFVVRAIFSLGKPFRQIAYKLLSVIGRECSSGSFQDMAMGAKVGLHQLLIEIRNTWNCSLQHDVTSFAVDVLQLSRH